MSHYTSEAFSKAMLSTCFLNDVVVSFEALVRSVGITYCVAKCCLRTAPLAAPGSTGPSSWNVREAHVAIGLTCQMGL